MTNTSNSYKEFKKRLMKLPKPAQKVILESAKQNLDKFKSLFNHSKENILTENQKMNNKDFVSKRFFLSLIAAGYDDRKAEKFVDFLMSGNYRSFIKNFETGIEKDFETNKPGKYKTVGRRQTQGLFGRQGGPKPVLRGTGKYDPNDPFGDSDPSNTPDDDAIDTKTAKNMQLVKPKSLPEKAKEKVQGGLDTLKQDQGVFDDGMPKGSTKPAAKKPAAKKPAAKKPAAKKPAAKKPGILSKTKDAVKKGVGKVKKMFEPNSKWRKQIDESIAKAVEQKDYKKLNLIKEHMRRKIERVILESLEGDDFTQDKNYQALDKATRANFEAGDYDNMELQQKQMKIIELRHKYKALDKAVRANFEAGNYDKMELQQKQMKIIENNLNKLGYKVNVSDLYKDLNFNKGYDSGRKN